MMCTPETLDLTLKGIPLVTPFFNTAMWDRWPDRWSPHCVLVVQSMVPALVLKSVSLCSNVLCRELNVRGILLGFGLRTTSGSGGICPFSVVQLPWAFTNSVNTTKSSNGRWRVPLWQIFGQGRWVHTHTGAFSIAFHMSVKSSSENHCGGCIKFAPCTLDTVLQVGAYIHRSFLNCMPYVS